MLLLEDMMDIGIERNYWDIAAGIILVKESGGFVESLNSGSFAKKK